MLYSTMTCRACSNEFVPSDRRGLARYCSTECRRKADSQRAIKGYHRRALKLRCTCKQCGVVFTPKCSNRNQFCSVTCRNRAIHATNAKKIDLSKRHSCYPACSVYFPECTQCRKPFCAQSKTVHLCSEACRKADEVLSNVAAHSGKRTCKECSTVFSVEYKDMRRFCSDICEQIAKSRARKRARKRGSKGSDRHRKRARRYGVEYEPIRLVKVLERDGWICGLCTGPISKDVHYPDPMMPSLDHVVPMSLGGPHTYDNVQAAHHRCNTKKSDSVYKEPLYYLDDLLRIAWEKQFRAS